MGMLKAAAIGVAGVLLAVQFKQGKTEYSVLIALGVSTLIFLGIAGQFSVFLDTIREIGDAANLDSAYLNTLVKMLGITYTAEFASGVCKDAGYQAIAAQIEIFAKLLILMLSVPVILTVLQQIGNFLS